MEKHFDSRGPLALALHPRVAVYELHKPDGAIALTAKVLTAP